MADYTQPSSAPPHRTIWNRPIAAGDSAGPQADVQRVTQEITNRKVGVAE